MKRRRWILLLAVCVALSAALVFAMFKEPPEPVFQGRALSEWVEGISPTVLTRPGPTAVYWGQPKQVTYRGRTRTVQIQRSGLPSFVSGPFGRTLQYSTQHIAAAQAIRDIGTSAVPHLLRPIYSKDPPWKRSLTAVWRKQSWVELPFETAIEKQERALPALRELGPAVVWTWVEILTNYSASLEVRQYAAGSLAEMRKGAVPALATLLEMQDHTNYAIRASVGAAIQYCDSDGFLSALYNARYSTNADVRAGAVWSLGHIGKNPDMSIPALARAANDESAHVRAAAIDALVKFDPAGNGTTNLIFRGLSDPERRVRKAATNALERMLPAGQVPSNR